MPGNPTAIKASIESHFASSAALLSRTGKIYSGLVLETAVKIVASLRSGGKVLTCGNGGSAADAEHIAAEMVGRFRRERCSLPAIALTSCTAALTAIGNDYGFEAIFARQVQGHGQQGDVLIAISTSGKSPNIIAAVKAAREKGLFTVALTGNGQPSVAEIADSVFAVPSAVTAEIQQCHIAIAHALCETIDELLECSQSD